MRPVLLVLNPPVVVLEFLTTGALSFQRYRIPCRRLCPFDMAPELSQVIAGATGDLASWYISLRISWLIGRKYFTTVVLGQRQFRLMVHVAHMQLSQAPSAAHAISFWPTKVPPVADGHV